MKSKILMILPVFMLLMATCNTKAPYKIKKVSVDFQVLEVGAGYATVKTSTSGYAYYTTGICELDSNQALPYTDEHHFMTMCLDELYIWYLTWRHDLLEQGVPYIASFDDHALTYGTVTHNISRLVPGQTYFIYGFVVDPKLREPVGNLYYKTFTCSDSSNRWVNFDYRVDHSWDFVYPLDMTDEIYSSHPYMVSTVSQRDLLKYFGSDTVGTDGHNKPAWYFYNEMLEYYYTSSDDDKICYGVYTMNHNTLMVDSDFIAFEPGETYYTGIFSADGMLKCDKFQVYKFTWQPEMQQDFSYKKDNIGMNW